MSSISFLFPLVLCFAIMYFFMIRPQQKRQKEIQNFRNSLTVGTDVVTAGGVYGKVKRLDADNTVMVEVANGVNIRVDRSCVYASAPVQQQA